MHLPGLDRHAQTVDRAHAAERQNHIGQDDVVPHHAVIQQAAQPVGLRDD